MAHPAFPLPTPPHDARAEKRVVQSMFTKAMRPTELQAALDKLDAIFQECAPFKQVTGMHDAMKALHTGYKILETIQVHHGQAIVRQVSVVGGGGGK